MAISITVFPVHIYSSHLSGYAAIELSSVAQKLILYYGIKISSTAQIDKIRAYVANALQLYKK